MDGHLLGFYSIALLWVLYSCVMQPSFYYGIQWEQNQGNNNCISDLIFDLVVMTSHAVTLIFDVDVMCCDVMTLIYTPWLETATSQLANG